MELKSSTTMANQSSGKLLRVIEAMATLDEPVKLSELGKLLDMQSSTLLRFLKALTQNGYVVQLPDSGRYTLSYKICRIAEQIKSHNDVVKILHKYLVSTRNYAGESAFLAKEEAGKVVYLDIVASVTHVIPTYRYIGSVAPMHCTGIGKLFLTQYSDSEIDRFISVQGLEKYTDRTLTTKEALCTELALIRRQGYALDNQECEIGARCIALPLRDYTGHIIAGMSVTAPSARMTDELIEKILPEVKKIALAASYALGYSVEE